MCHTFLIIAYVIICQVEEIKTELELRLHLHKPRPLRVKQDIRDVRKGTVS